MRNQRPSSPEDSATSTVETGEKGPNEQFCTSCGSIVKQDAVICPSCGVRRGEQHSSTDPGLAAILSGIGFFVPIAAGAGQIYNGQIGKGLLFSVLQVFNSFLLLVLIGFLTYPIVGLYAIYDAHQHAG